ncbi:SGNH/GDSL hydrolase family protein [Frigoribacterium sp. PvP032]|uniref:SGNH/GDSL hydrolase family protein n=1 Tax=Frigoribacterium sp. PvP032 TaxID=2806589 RepID=UPI001AEA8705|nr:SGNH/GDSL hydrolase family protein [Frigoribacterium sp. PvP032]MBP1191293.1 lysophospholipase L1-like esterase [Frigoribacterium sp. PvP032]
MDRAKIAGAALAAAGLALLATGCSAPATTASFGSAPASAPQAAASAVPGDHAADEDRDAVRVAIVGDSLTAGGGRLLSDGLDANTWMTYARGDGVEWVGGYAKGGSTIQEQAAVVTPVADVDVLVLMSGTNDVRKGIGFAESAASYDAVVATIAPRHVVVAAIPPYDRSPAAAAVYQRALERHVLEKGWTWTDPWGFARDGLVFAAGTSPDGIHPTTAGYQRLGESLRETILDVGDPRDDLLQAGPAVDDAPASTSATS